MTEPDPDTNADSDLSTRLRADDPLVGCWIMAGHPVLAEFPAQQGFDFLAAHSEQTENDAETLASVVRAVDAAEVTGTPVGTLATTLANPETRHAWDMDYMTAGTDHGPLRDAGARYREADAESSASARNGK